MAKYDKKGRSKNYVEPFVKLEKGFLEGCAWKALNAHARLLYIELKKHFNGSNNGDIGLSVREAARNINCSNNTANRAFKDLTEKGFIKKRSRGFLGFEGKGISAKYELTDLPYRGNRATYDYKNPRPQKNNIPSPEVRQSVAKNETDSNEVSQNVRQVSPKVRRKTPKKAPEVSQ